MNAEREERVSNLLKYEYKEGFDASVKTTCLNRALTARGIPRDSSKLKELEQQGFIVIFPAELTKEALSQLSENQMNAYNREKDSALIIDKQANEELSMDFAEDIVKHYNKLRLRDVYTGSVKGPQEETMYLGEGLDEKANEKLQQILSEIGFDTTLEENGRNGVNIKSDAPRRSGHVVSKSDYYGIYRSVKPEQVKGAFDDLRQIKSYMDVEQKKDSEQR